MAYKALAFVENAVTLSLSNSITWSITAGNIAALPVVSRFADVMQLVSCGKVARRLIVSVRENFPYWTRIPSADDGAITCPIQPPLDADILAMQMMRIAAVIALDVERQGGLLLHGALVERDGHGVILAGPSGAGKTTATQRLSRPWRSLSDDATLVIRDKQGKYYAHPWPTWSRFLSGKSGGVWDVQDGVPLKGIFLLNQTQDDQIIPVNFAQAVCLLVESVEQASCMLSRGMNKDEERNLRLNRFDNICALAQVVTYHFLHLSLTGCFWREIERVIIGSGKGAS